MASLPHGSLARVARPIHGEDELDQLLDLVGDARIVMIGDATHGSHELYDLRASLTRRLIREHGFRAVAIDSDWPDALRVDRYVRTQGDEDSADLALDAFDHFPAWRWRNADVASFVDWLRTQNCCRRSADRVGFYGLDLYSSSASMRATLSYFDELDAYEATRARAYFASGGSRGCITLDDDLLAELVEMQWRRAARSGRAPSGDAWCHAMQTAHVVSHAEAYYRAAFGGTSEAWNQRSTHLADTLDMLAQHLASTGDPAKVVVWAHDTQVGDARATDLGRCSLGQLMRTRHPDEVALVGLTTHGGTLRCATAWDEDAVVEELWPSPPGSWEAMFHELGLPRFMVTGSAIKRTLGDEVRRIHRSIPIVYRPEDVHGYASQLGDQYDVIVHVDTTRAVVPIVHAMRPEDETAAETRSMTEASPGM